MAGSEQRNWIVAAVVVLIVIVAVLGIWLLALTRFAELTSQVNIGIGTFLIGLLGAGVLVFAARMGLKGYERLPEKIYTARNIVLFILIGGLLAIIVWLQTPTLFTPLYSFGIGAAWPAAVQGFMIASLAKTAGDDQTEEFKKLLERVGGR